MNSQLTRTRIADSGGGRGTGRIDTLIQGTHDELVSDSESRRSSAKPRVLIVDDDFHLLNVFALWLNSEGLEVMTAVDGVQALMVVEHTRPDLVVADVVMPRMDGIRLAEELRKRQIPTILTSANTLPLSVDPDIPFIGKPFDLVELSSLITHVLDQAPEAQARNH